MCEVRGPDSPRDGKEAPEALTGLIHHACGNFKINCDSLKMYIINSRAITKRVWKKRSKIRQEWGKYVNIRIPN